MCDLRREAIEFHFIMDLEDWSCLQTEPFLAGSDGSRGPIMWRPTKDADGNDLPALGLVASALVSGYALTYLQMKQLLLGLGGNAGGQPSKPQLRELLIQAAVPNSYMEKARVHLGQVAEEEEVDSNYSEVISELGQDDANANDLKELRQKKKHRKLKKALKTQAEIVEMQAKAKSKAKASKAKAKPKCKRSAKGLVGALVERARKRHQEAKQREKELDDEIEKDLRETLEPFLESAASGGIEPSEQAPEIANEEPEEPPNLPSSSTGPSVEVEASSCSGVDGPNPASSAKGSEAGGRAKQVKMNKSPSGLMQTLAPPGCSLTLGFDDHRVKNIYRVSGARLKGCGKLAQEHYSSSFASKRDWVTALKEVHAHVWEKWRILRSRFPLPCPHTAQSPGLIPQDISEALEPTMLKIIATPPKKQLRIK